MYQYFTFKSTGSPLLQQILKFFVVILCVVTFASRYLYFQNSRSSFLVDNNSVKSVDSENTSALEKAKYNLEILQGHHKSNVKKTVSTNHLKQETKINGETHDQPRAQHSPDPLITNNEPFTANKESKGYILPYSVYEEQTSAANNLWLLQVWAKQVGMEVVEPFVKDSFITMNQVIPNLDKGLRFSDYFDKEQWNEMVTKAGGTPLVPWEEFFNSDSPRDAIILHTLRKGVGTAPLIIAYDENATICDYKQISKKDMLWVEENFNVIKKICYLCAENFPHHISVEEFYSLIFSNNGINPSDVVLIVVNWLGIKSGRVHLEPLSLFDNSAALQENFTYPPSERIMTAYKRYIKVFIGHHKYVGINFRTYRVMYFSHYTNQSEYLVQCSKSLGNVLDKVRNKWKIFLAYDLGMFGSKMFLRKMNKLAPLQKQIFQDVFKGSMQVHEREKHLINAANGIKDRGFIAQLERVITTHADCIILLGPHSRFVQASGLLYLSLHPNKHCIVTVCASKVYDQNNEVVSTHAIPDEFINGR